MIISEGPGQEENLSGKPFVGAAGNLLTKMLN
ncbi:MAG: uracil-DNA glycosylase, partial [Candidatus Cloacimonetes bacterium]|nr:uracil-DNA glycosylase [Candidatus Cloacimonadota bacterium]